VFPGATQRAWLAYAENTQSAYFVKTGERWIGSLLKGINGKVERILLKGGEVFNGRQKHAERAVTGGELRVKGGTECDGDAWFRGHLSRRHGCRGGFFIPPHRFGRCAVVFHLTAFEVACGSEPRREHGAWSMEPEGCGANGQIFVDNEHFGFQTLQWRGSQRR
jgi:hypothetical protein